jgi:DegV family protein with EDD domain
MGKIAILTDSNSGITPKEAEALGIFVMPMPFFINGELYLENINLSTEEFYDKLQDGAEISTSMPAVADTTDMWDKLLKEFEEVVYIPMSSGLSSSCSTAIMLSDDYDGKVQVINNQRISVTQRRSVYDAIALAEAGKNAAEIKEILEKTAFDSSIYITVDTLKYLKKGGRLTPAVAAIGTLLRIKPVLQIQGEKLDTFAKARTMKQAKSQMLEQVIADAKNRFNDPTGDNCYFDMAYTYNTEAAEEYKKEVLAAHPNFDIHIDPLSLSVSCHIGPGSLAITCSKKFRVEDWV